MWASTPPANSSTSSDYLLFFLIVRIGVVASRPTVACQPFAKRGMRSGQLQPVLGGDS